jgi:hypothetical protein
VPKSILPPVSGPFSIFFGQFLAHALGHEKGANDQSRPMTGRPLRKDASKAFKSFEKDLIIFSACQRRGKGKPRLARLSRDAFHRDSPLFKLVVKRGNHAQCTNGDAQGIGQAGFVHLGCFNAPDDPAGHAIVIDDLGVAGAVFAHGKKICAPVRGVKGGLVSHFGSLCFYCSEGFYGGIRANGSTNHFTNPRERVRKDTHALGQTARSEGGLASSRASVAIAASNLSREI